MVIVILTRTRILYIPTTAYATGARPHGGCASPHILLPSQHKWKRTRRHAGISDKTSDTHTHDDTHSRRPAPVVRFTALTFTLLFPPVPLTGAEAHPGAGARKRSPTATCPRGRPRYPELRNAATVLFDFVRGPARTRTCWLHFSPTHTAEPREYRVSTAQTQTRAPPRGAWRGGAPGTRAAGLG